MEELQSTFSSFGTLLKTYRKRKRLTQQQLAQRIGVHANTVSSWELGTYLPATHGMVLELARHLTLDESETRRFLEASLTALSPYWHVPLARNPFFTGREELLQTLHARLDTDQVVALTQSYALHGLGGVGKTQLALEYVYRHTLAYRAIFWIEAETLETIVSSLLRIAAALQLPERDEKDQQRVVVAVSRWLTGHNQWLLIWDNVEDLALLDQFLPATRQGTILITTRHQTLGTRAQGIDLFPMEQEEGLLFLLRRAKVLETNADSAHMQQFAKQAPRQYAAAAELVMAMGGLPLALDQAGAYLEETRCTLTAYLDLFHNQRAALLKHRGEGVHIHPASVSATLTLAIEAVVQRHPAGEDLLRACAFLQPEAIPEELFLQGAEHLGTQLQVAGSTTLDWNQLISVVCSYSLLSRQAEAQTLSMHRLAQAVLQETLTQRTQTQWKGQLTAALEQVFPVIEASTEHTVWKQCERLLPHALLLLSDPLALEGNLTEATLAYKVALYLLQTRGVVPDIEALLQRALHLREHLLGREHPDLIDVLNAQAQLAWMQGHYTEAEQPLQRALHLREQQQGRDHPQVAQLLSNLGLLYQEQGCYAEAQPLYQRALHIYERMPGQNQIYAAISLQNLALLAGDQGHYREMEAQLRRVLQTYTQELGPSHPRVATSLTLLARSLREQGHTSEAEEHLQHALHIWERQPTPEHPDAAGPLCELAELYQSQGYVNKALPFAERALQLRSQFLGDAHPETIATRTLCVQLAHQHGNAEESAPSQGCVEEKRDGLGKGNPLERPAASAHTTTPTILYENELFQEFLRACCELHPRAWSRASDLWKTYEQWTERHQKRFPLSHRAFTNQLKAYGCRADRTKTTRIWRGISIITTDDER